LWEWIKLGKPLRNQVCFKHCCHATYGPAVHLGYLDDRRTGLTSSDLLLVSLNFLQYVIVPPAQPTGLPIRSLKDAHTCSYHERTLSLDMWVGREGHISLSDLAGTTADNACTNTLCIHQHPIITNKGKAYHILFS
jgi:hypothetical protein